MKKMMTFFFVTATLLAGNMIFAGEKGSGGGGGGMSSSNSGGSSGGGSACPEVQKINVGDSCKDFYGQRSSGAVKPVCFGAHLHLYQKKHGIGEKWHKFLAPCKKGAKENIKGAKGKK